MAKFDFRHERWKSVSEEAKQLIRSMLTRLPADRFSIDQVVAHGWLKDVVSAEKDRLKKKKLLFFITCF